MMYSKTALLYSVLYASVAPPLVTAGHDVIKIGTYTPAGDIWALHDKSALSKDQQVILQLLRNPTQSQFGAAKRVYEEGGSSGPIATVFVPGGVPQALRGGSQDEVYAKNVAGESVIGGILEDVPAGGTIVKVVYQTPHESNECMSGGLPRNERITDGCYNATGTMTLSTPYGTPTVSFEYEYDINKNNTNVRTIQSFSTNADTLMRVGGIDGNPYYDSFRPFVDYYGRADYADNIIQSAVVNNDTDLLNGNLYMKDAGYGQRAAAQVFFKGTAYMIMSMAVLNTLETAVDQCDRSCNIGECDHWAIASSLDEAVVYFRGQHDVFMSHLNSLRCANFGTCHDTPTVGDAIANVKVFELFNEMQMHFLTAPADCDKARDVIPKVASQLWVGIIQGILRYAWLTDSGDHNPASSPTDIAQAEGAIYAAAILPLIYECNPNSARTINNNLTPNERVGCDFVAVKKALESCYAELGITCTDVGGLIDGTGKYTSCATLPCGKPDTFKAGVPECCLPQDSINEPGCEESSDGSGSLGVSGATSTDQDSLVVILGSVLGGLAFITMLALCFIRNRDRPDDKPELESTDEELDAK